MFAPPPQREPGGFKVQLDGAEGLIISIKKRHLVPAADDVDDNDDTGGDDDDAHDGDAAQVCWPFDRVASGH